MTPAKARPILVKVIERQTPQNTSGIIIDCLIMWTSSQFAITTTRLDWFIDEEAPVLVASVDDVPR
jgi:hypothetical protein